MKRITIAIPVFKRYYLTKILLEDWVRRIERFSGKTKYRILIGTHEDYYINLAEKLNISYLDVNNDVLGEKFNSLIFAASSMGDGVVLMGSDDFPLTYFCNTYKDFPEKNVDAFGLQQMYMADWETSKAKKVWVRNSFIGAGFYFSSDLILELMIREGRIFPHFKKGLDGSMIALLRKHKIQIKTVEQENPIFVDWKSNENLHKFEQIQGNEINISEITEKMDAETYKQLEFYKKVVN
jgi:hypothetical protein